MIFAEENCINIKIMWEKVMINTFVREVVVSILIDCIWLLIIDNDIITVIIIIRGRGFSATQWAKKGNESLMVRVCFAFATALAEQANACKLRSLLFALSLSLSPRCFSPAQARRRTTQVNTVAAAAAAATNVVATATTVPFLSRRVVRKRYRQRGGSRCRCILLLLIIMLIVRWLLLLAK